MNRLTIVRTPSERTAIVDSRSAAFVNRDLAVCLAPIHADIPEVDAVMLDGSTTRPTCAA